MAQNLLRVQEVAESFGTSKCLVYTLVCTGDLQVVRINSFIQFRFEEIHDFIDRNLSIKKKSTHHLPECTAENWEVKQ